MLLYNVKQEISFLLPESSEMLQNSKYHNSVHFDRRRIEFLLL